MHKIMTTLKASLMALSFCIALQSLSAYGIEGSSLQRDDGSVITYYLEAFQPEVEGKVLLVILHGSDCNSVTKIASIRNDLRKAWSEADLLTIEKYGIDSGLVYSSDGERLDCPSEYLLNDSPEQRTNDVVSVLDYFKEHNKYRNIILLGGSEGALVSNLVAARLNYLSASISFNGGGRWFLDDVVHNIRSLAESSEGLEEEVDGFKQFAEQIVSGKPFDLNMSNHGYTWWHNALTIDQENVVLNIASPLLLIQSGLDKSVSPSSAADMAGNLKNQGKNNVTYREYKNLDHGLNDISGNSKMSSVAKDIEAWLMSVIH
jgi:pimeloyl-ACP methyl ester carboxylesterase